MKHNLVLDIEFARGKVRAIFSFKTQNNKFHGNFEMRGRYIPKIHQFEFLATNWLQRPDGYSMVDMSGNLIGGNYVGQIVWKGTRNVIGEFHLTKQN